VHHHTVMTVEINNIT